MSVNKRCASIMCSRCSSMAHFSCLEHCNDVFCGKCSIKHRIAIGKTMEELSKNLQKCHIEPIAIHDEIDSNLLCSSQQAIQYTRETTNMLINEIQKRESTIIKQIDSSLQVRRLEREKRINSAVLTSEEAINYSHVLSDCLKRDRLLDANTMIDIKNRLDARNAINQSTSDAKTPVIELGKFDVDKLLTLQFSSQSELCLSTKKSQIQSRKTVTIGLNKRKVFKSSLQPSFSIGRHPIMVSFNDRYLETFFIRRSDNNLILLSTTAIDVVNRGSGIELSIRLSKILGTTKDKILAGTWCEHCQRLILNGNHRMYFFSMQAQQHADKFRCAPVQSEHNDTPRFLNCLNDGSIFYAYKSNRSSYTIQKLCHPALPSPNPAYEPIDSSKFLSRSVNDKCIQGQVAAMCVAQNRLAIVYRRLEIDKQLNHYICLFDHNLNKINSNDFLLPAYTKWVTAMTSYAHNSQYLLCDPRGQQLLLYRSTDGFLTRRLRIGAANACCLTDGKLVLWLQKQYSTTPTAKLHFIVPPHIEKADFVSKSMPLLTEN